MAWFSLTTLFRQTIAIAAFFATVAYGGIAHASNNAAASEDKALAQAELIWAIVGYTRWPTQPETLQMCIMDDSAVAKALKKHKTYEGLSQPNIRELPLKPSSLALNDCHVLHVGSLPLPQLSATLQAIHNSPILTIGTTSDFCSLGGLFCIHLDGQRFFANLSAIAQSTLRINPRVLQLSKKQEVGQ